jgi:hypothetical protein
MASSVAWLDTSAEEQRHVREVLNLFAQSESRDELGIGQIRDAFSDALFPGTSVIQTRARYFLVVPWLYRAGAARRSGVQLEAWVKQRERWLIEVMRREGHTEGLIGRVAGPNVKILPSTIYWSGLIRYGILQHGAGQDRLGMPAAALEADELAERARGDWHPTLPRAPEGFPDSLPGGFELTAEEASWLAERMCAAASGRLLAHLITAQTPVDLHSAAPWEDPASPGAPEEVAEVLDHAELFSLALHGAALLYNVLVGEEYERAGLTRVEDPAEAYRGRLQEWSATCRSHAARLAVWDRARFWDLARAENPRIGTLTRGFVDRWLDAVVTGQAAGAADDGELRALVRAREQVQKKGQARLTNRNLLTTWSGASGSARLDYRWATVRRLVADIREGLGTDAVA